MASVFHTDPEELIQLRRIEQHKLDNSAQQGDIKDIIQLLLSIDEDRRKPILATLRSKLQKLLIRRYDDHKINQLVLEVKGHWLDLVKNSFENKFKWRSEIGYFCTAKQEIYFDLQLNESAMILSSLQEESQSVSKQFEELIGEPSVKYAGKIAVPLYPEPRNATVFMWFSPMMSVLDKYNFLCKQNIDWTSIECNENQLLWCIQHDNMNEQSKNGNDLL
jgi:hypothetical protein